MQAAIPTIIVDIGSLLVFFGVVVATSSLPPVRWLWRTLVADPIGRWLDRRHEESLGPLVLSFEEHTEYVRYHLGPNGTTRPIHERIRRLEEVSGVPRQEDED